MLHLHARTPDDWAPWAAAHIDEILVDHAHCEKKAASTAIGLLFRYPDHAPLQVPLSALAREELEHFELVLEHLAARGVPFGRQRPSPYAGKLMQVVRGAEPHRLLDTLLCCAVIEARSCERMRLLADALTEAPPLAALYRGLLASEARHHMLYVDLATELFPGVDVRARLDAVCAHEAAVLREAPRVPRMHN